MDTIRNSLLDEQNEFIEPELAKRFWVFATTDYDEWGGLKDIQATFNTLEEAEKCSLECDTMDRIYIFDREENKIINKK